MVDCALLLTALSSAPLNEWVQKQRHYAEARIIEAANPADGLPGALIASPSRENPPYYFVWIRDAAISLGPIVSRLETEKDPASIKTYERLLENYASFSRKVQRISNLSGSFTDSGPGEPKFHVDGTPFWGDWGRPQTDGPALRAITLIRYANYLLGQERSAASLYDGRIPAETLIKADLEYVAHHWREPCHDLWEENVGFHFFNLMVQRKALLRGAALAERLDDNGGAAYYRREAKEISLALESFWNADEGFIVATRNGKKKRQGLDVAVALGVLHGMEPGQSFGIFDDRVLSTVWKLKNAFHEEFPVNQTQKTDLNGELLGTGIGRYLNDLYDGYDTDSRGNAWFLATLSLGEFFYLRSDQRIIPITAISRPLFSEMIGEELKAGESLIREDPRFGKIVRALHLLGDRQLLRVRSHANENGQMDEQFHRDFGYMLGANHLTWNYAAFLKATASRFDQNRNRSDK